MNKSFMRQDGRHSGRSRSRSAALRSAVSLAAWFAVLLAMAFAAGCGSSRPPRMAQPHQPIYAPYPQWGQVAAIDRIRLGRSPKVPNARVGEVAGVDTGRPDDSGDDRLVPRSELEVSRSPDAPEIFRITVRMNDGNVRAFDYASLGRVRLGDRVRVQDGRIFLF